MGYSGGTLENPTYYKLGDHTETIEIDFDPRRVSYEGLLEVFWRGHNPHAAPFSIQYKSAVFFHGAEQERLARESAARIASESGSEVTTEILPASRFYRAEDYHQKYYLRNNGLLLGELARYYAGRPKEFTDSTLAARLNGYAGHYGSAEQLTSELDAYGLSQAARDHLLSIAPSLSSEAAFACGLGK